MVCGGGFGEFGMRNTIKCSLKVSNETKIKSKYEIFAIEEDSHL